VLVLLPHTFWNAGEEPARILESIPGLVDRFDLRFPGEPI
jgi:hypothetical protein